MAFHDVSSYIYSYLYRDQVEEGMSSGGSTGIAATPAPTPFSHGPGGVRPEDLAAGISRLAVHFVIAPYFKIFNMRIASHKTDL